MNARTATTPADLPYVEDAALITLAALDRGRASEKYLAAGARTTP